MLKLKLQYYGHLMQRTDSLEKTLMLGKIEGGRKRGRQNLRTSFSREREKAKNYSVDQSCPALSDPMDCSTPGFPVLVITQSLLKLTSMESVMPSNHLILCRPLLLLPSIFPSISDFFP